MAKIYPIPFLLAIEYLISKDICPSKAFKILGKMFEDIGCYNTVAYSLIKKSFNKKWSKHEKKYVIVDGNKPSGKWKRPYQGVMFSYDNNDYFSTDLKELTKIINMKVDSFLLESDDSQLPNANNKSEIPQEDVIEKNASLDNKDNQVTSIKDTPQNNAVKQNDQFNFNAILLNEIKTISSNIDTLSVRLRKVENFINNYIQDPPEKKIKKELDDFIDIYKSESKKKSVNINPKIKDKVLYLMKKNHGIDNNTSLAINTALLITLKSEEEKK